MNPPEDVIETVRFVYDDLPEDARAHYVTDETLIRWINAARRQFNQWLGKLKREKLIPSPVEAGPSNYPVRKVKNTARYERKAKEELNEKIRRIAAGARGGRQRALNAVGSSVAEQTGQKARSTIEQRREEW